jgi:hypothetical protein
MPWCGWVIAIIVTPFVLLFLYLVSMERELRGQRERLRRQQGNLQVEVAELQAQMAA